MSILTKGGFYLFYKEIIILIYILYSMYRKTEELCKIMD